MSAPTSPEPRSVEMTHGAPSGRSWSLSARLALWYAGSAFCLVALITGALYWALEHHFDVEDNAALADQMQILRGHLGHAGDLQAMLHSEVVEEAAARRFNQVYVRILDADGHDVIETPGMDAIMAVDAFPAPDPDPTTLVINQQVMGHSGDPFRVVCGAAIIAGHGTGTIQIALNNRGEVDLLAQYRRWLIILLGVALAVSTAGGYLLAHRGLRPLADLAVAISGIGSATLNERIPAVGLPTELVTLAASFNATLARLEDAFSRLRRFSADIAHELRTPVNNLRGEAEVALGKARSADDYRVVLASSLEECARLSRLIDTLLFLARAESPHTKLVRVSLDLSRDLDGLRAFYAAAAEEAGITLTVSTAAGITLNSDRTLLHRAVGNLIENALTYTPAGGRITLSAERQGGRLRITVADSGRGIPPEHLPYVFDRFHRVEQARSNVDGHVGLGLAIVRSIAVLHGGSADIASTVGEGTTVTISLPDDETVMNSSGTEV